MKKAITILSLVLLVLAGFAAAADLSQYPAPFVSAGSFNAQIIAGSTAPATDSLAATDIALALQQVSGTQIRAGLEDEYDSSKNAILIGLPCQNPILASVLGTTACDFGLPEGTGYLKFVEKNGITNLIVSGKTAADTRRAARALANYRSYGLTGDELLITGTLDSPLTQKPESPIQIKAGTTAPSALPTAGETTCSTDSGCADDKWCRVGTCTDLGCPAGTIAKNHDCIKEVKAAEIPKPEIKNEAPKAEQPKVEQPNVEKKGFFARIGGFFRSLFGRK